MGKVIDLKGYAAERALRQGLGLWRRCFPEELTRETRLADLSDQTLLALARLGPETTPVLYELIMGLLGLGSKDRFPILSGPVKMKVLDIYLFVVDQIRWECMRRLGWISGFPAEEYPLVELIWDHQTIKSGFSPPSPRLSKTHPDFPDFERAQPLGGEAVLRRLIPAALTVFAQKVQT